MWCISQLDLTSDLYLKVLFSGTFSPLHTKDVLMIALTFQSDLFIIINIKKKKKPELKSTIPCGFEVSVVKKGRNSLGEHLLTWQHKATHIYLQTSRQASWFHSFYPQSLTWTGWSITYSCCQSRPLKTINLVKIQICYTQSMGYASEVARVLRQELYYKYLAFGRLLWAQC